MVAVAILLPLAALVVVVAPCIPTQGPDDDEWWDELSPTTSMLLKYSTTTVNEPTSTIYVTPLPTTTESTSTTSPTTTSSTTSTTTTTSTTSTSTTTTTTLPPLPAGCPTTGAIYAGNGHYYFVTGIGGSDPEYYCDMQCTGAHAASLTDMAENTWAFNFLQSQGVPQLEVHIGGRSTTPGIPASWYWSDGSTYLYDNWDIGGGYPMGGTNQCMTMITATGLWGNTVCSTAYRKLCEIAL